MTTIKRAHRILFGMVFAPETERIFPLTAAVHKRVTSFSQVPHNCSLEMIDFLSLSVLLSLLRVQAQDFVGVPRAAHDDRATVVDVLGHNVQNAAHLVKQFHDQEES
jgi:hypothetical protein